MSTVAIDQIQPGMVLAEDVRSPDGRLLLPAGAELQARHLDLLRKQKVGQVVVRGNEGLDEEALTACLDYVRGFFSTVDPDCPAMDAMFRIAAERAAEHMAGGWTPPSSETVAAVEHAHLRDMFYKDEGRAEDVVDAEVKVASFPDVYFRIREVIDKPSASAADVAEVVGADIGLSTKLLKLVNSPFYGLSSKVDSISRAVALVGVREVSTLALGISTINAFKDIPPELINMEMFWRHSMSCGVLSRVLAGMAGLKGERFFTAGLLHDVGRLVLFKKLPYASVQALLYARGNQVPLVEAEAEVIGFDHEEVGRILLERWNFPDHLRDLVGHHHTPLDAGSAREAAIIQTADSLANALAVADGQLFAVPGVGRKAWQAVGINADLLPLAVQNFDRALQDLLEAFF